MAEEKNTVTLETGELISLLKQLPREADPQPQRAVAESKEMQRIDIRDVFEALLKHWFIIVLSALLCGVAALMYIKLTYVPSYTASSKMYINNETSLTEVSKTEISQGDINTSKSLVETCKNVVKMRGIVEPAREILKEQYNLDYTYNELAAKITGGSLNGTEIFSITVHDTNPDRAMTIANVVADSFQKRISDIVIGSSARIVDPAGEAKMQDSRTVVKVMLAVIVGFLLPCAIVILVECIFNDKVEKSEWLQKTYPNHPVLSTIPDVNSTNRNGKGRYRYGYGRYKYGYNKYYKYYKHTDVPQNEELVIRTEKTRIASRMDFETSEANNVLRTNILLSFNKSETGKIIGVTSSTSHEGKSFTAVNLAYSFAKNGYKTLLVSGDMRLPKCEKYLDQSLTPGLSNVLVGNADPDESVREVLIRNLSFLPAGDIPPNPSELMWSNEMKRLLDHYSKQYRYVIIDLPPVTAVIDPVSVSPLLDGMIVIVRHAFSRKQYIRRAMSQLSFSGVRVLGFVYNGYHRGTKRYSKTYRKYYKSGYERDYSKPYAPKTAPDDGNAAASKTAPDDGNAIPSKTAPDDGNTTASKKASGNGKKK